MITDKNYSQYCTQLVQGQRWACQEIVQEYLDRDIDVQELYTALFQRSLYRVGELWSLNRLSVATEHLATSITEGLMTLVYPRIFNTDRTGKSVVVSCIANEYHQIGAKMVADTFEMYGWDGYFLGADTPLQDLLHLVDSKSPDAICLSLSVYFNIPRLLEAITALRTVQTQAPILVGGHAFQVGGTAILSHYPEVTHIDSLASLEAFIKSVSN